MSSNHPQNSSYSPQLEAKLAPWTEKLLHEGSVNLLTDWIARYGSPLHVVVKSEFKRNATALLAPLEERGLAGNLYFARKANKLPWFVKAAQEAGLGVDTASDGELRETLALGVDPTNIVVTAVGKNEKLVTRAIATGSLLVADNEDELGLIAATAAAIGREARVGLRFSGFKTDRLIESRFGFPINEAVKLIGIIQENRHFKLELLHAHLDRYDVFERAAAARRLVECIDLTGGKIKAIDLGGGILIRYLQKQEHWQAFLEALDQADSGRRPPFTWKGDNFGLTRTPKADGTVELSANLYPAWNDLSKERFITAILDNADGAKPLHQELKERGIALHFEPGRALLDNCGLTLASVCLRKRDTAGNMLLGLEMNHTNLQPFRAEFTVDPYHLASGRRRQFNEGAYLVGNLCAESDLIMRRKVFLGHLPECGDIICFPNSAGYLAHHMETPTHGGILPANILIDGSNVKDSFGYSSAAGLEPAYISAN